MTERDVVAATDRVADTAARNRTFWIPDLASEALDEVVVRQFKQGYPTKRADVIAALILELLNRPQDDVERMLRAYACATVEDAFAERVEDGTVAMPPEPTRGPRRRRFQPKTN